MILKLLTWALIAVIAYFLGNISSGLIIGRIFGHTDIRKHGSGNAGTTNVLRTLGWLPSVLTLVGDTVKALLAVVIGRALGGELGCYVAGIAVLLGHNWPALFNFKGGKGIACSLGIILATEPWMGFALLAFQIVVLAITRYMSVASILSAIAYPVLVACLHGENTAYVVFAVLMGALAIFCHRANIKRLISRTESRLDFSKINKLSKKK